MKFGTSNLRWGTSDNQGLELIALSGEFIFLDDGKIHFSKVIQVPNSKVEVARKRIGEMGKHTLESQLLLLIEDELNGQLFLSSKPGLAVNESDFTLKPCFRGVSWATSETWGW